MYFLSIFIIKLFPQCGFEKFGAHTTQHGANNLQQGSEIPQRPKMVGCPKLVSAIPCQVYLCTMTMHWQIVRWLCVGECGPWLPHCSLVVTAQQQQMTLSVSSFTSGELTSRKPPLIRLTPLKVL